MSWIKKIIDFIIGLFSGRDAAVEAQAKQDAATVTVATVQAHEATVTQAAQVQQEIVIAQQEVKQHFEQQVQQQDPVDPFHSSDWNKEKL